MILTVCGGKGGVGKSTVALALGHALDAVVVDADVGMPDLPSDAGPTLRDVVAGRVPAAEAIRDDWAVAVVPADRSLAASRELDPVGVGEALQAIERAGDTVVVDGPAGLGADAAVPMTVADACVLVTTPTTPAIADAVRTRAVARELETGIGAVVLNRVGDERPPVEKRLGGPVVALPESDAVARATAQGLPVTLSSPDGDAAETIRSLAARLRRVTRRSRF
ncbi:MAG: chromosome partitioning protein ParA [Halanaeroarchaeum sp.]